MSGPREQILAMLSACQSCTTQELYGAIPATTNAVRCAILRLESESLIQRVGRGMYRLAQANKPPVLPTVAAGGFISPIPKHRLMAGRA
jgi:predicted transcriptional regulator